MVSLSFRTTRIQDLYHTTKGRLKTYISGFQTTFLLLKRLTAQSVMTDIDGFLFVARIGDEDDFFVHFADGFHVFARVVQLMQEIADTVEAGAFFVVAK